MVANLGSLSHAIARARRKGSHAHARDKQLPMNNSTVATLMSRDELLAFILPLSFLATIGIVTNSIIVYLYMRYATLRAKGGMHMIALLALYDSLHSAGKLHVCLKVLFCT